MISQNIWYFDHYKQIIVAILKNINAYYSYVKYKIRTFSFKRKIAEIKNKIVNCCLFISNKSSS